jgi:hypothetical protein
MFLTWLMLVVALCLSAVAAFYSIVGLTAIFAAAVVPIIIMGSMLEIAKLTVTVWLHEYWRDVKWTMKAYLVPAVAILMVITSMGIFGFLSKAHLDQAVPTGDVAAKVAIFDEKIKTQRDNIEAARRALTQMDAQVDQVLGRSTDEKGAERAVQIRRNQQAERNRLQRDIARAQEEISKLNSERAPIASELRKVEAEVGPVKYIAALIYGDNPDTNLLEKAVRWVIIILVIVFDPLAIFMLLAATESYRWEKARRQGDHPDEFVPDSFFETTKNIRERVKNLWPWGNKNADDAVDTTITKSMDGQSPGSDLGTEPVAEMVEPALPPTIAESKIDYQVIGDADDETPDNSPHLYVSPEVMIPDDEIDPETGKPHRESVVTFGNEWPRYAHKGDLFVKTSTLPTSLHKFNGTIWIDIDKKITDRYAYNEEYIQHLISKVSSGEYDPELLTDAEREQIEQQLKKNLS